MIQNDKLDGDLNLCCGQPPRLISGEGIGYNLVCMCCGRGLSGKNVGMTYQSAAYSWNKIFNTWVVPKVNNPGTVILKELDEAHAVLRNLACTLGVGGYNATNVDAEVFGNKIHEGIDMLTAPLLKQIEDLQADKERLLGRVADEVVSGFEKDEKIAQNKEAVVAELILDGCSYTFKKNGMVDVVILKSGRGFTRHINSVGLSVQQALEKQLSGKEV